MSRSRVIFDAMRRALIALVVLAGTATADKKAPLPPATLPAAGDTLELTGTPSWGKLDWLYADPSPADSAGKVIVHWFCTTKVKECTDDLARAISLRDAGHVYVIAYINGSKYDAKKLDPIRESEGVGRGTVAFGPGVAKLAKAMGITGAASIVVDVDGKVALVSQGADPAQLDARDAKVTALAGAIKDFTTVFDGPKSLKAGAQFQLKITIKLAAWLKYKQPMTFEVTAPNDIKCDAKSLKNDQLKLDGQNLVAVATCTAPRGNYEAQGKIHFEYTLPTRETGIGEDGTTWKFEVTP
jgi:hypothetical protein